MTVQPARRQIDMQTYARADILRAFVDRQMPQFSLTCEVDVTVLHRVCKAQGVSFFLGISYAVSHAVQAVPQLRHRVIEGVLYEYEHTHPNYTVAREGDLFSFCDGVHTEDFASFCRKTQALMDEVQSKPDLSVHERHHVFFISYLPWLRFTAFTHPYDPIYAYIPVITLGQFEERGGTVTMPVGMQVHHGVVDGVHAARFYQALRKQTVDAADWVRLTPNSPA